MKRRYKVAKNSFYYKDDTREIKIESDHPGYFQNCLARVLEAEIIPPMEEEKKIFYASSIVGGETNLDQGTGAPEFGHKVDEANTLLGASKEELEPEPEPEKLVRVPGYAGEPPDDIGYLKSPRIPEEDLPDALDD